MNLDPVEIPDFSSDLFEDLMGEIEYSLKDLFATDQDVKVWREGKKLIVGLEEEELVRKFLVPGRIVVLRRQGGSSEGSVELVISKTISNNIGLIENELYDKGLI